MNIARLPEAVIDQIAAGEVVERPASVVKELLENALDAGARSIHVEFSGGGTKRIRVSDDGSGIRAAEARLAFSRHATSKLRATEDLSELRTLGFRGEALATIAAVSQLRALTRHADDELGTLIRIDGGAWQETQRQAAPRGTMITIENLFYNTPARLKFLRRPATERRQLARVVQRYAYAFPETRFACFQDERELFRTSGNGDHYDALVQLLGLAQARQLLAIPETQHERHRALRGVIQVSGHVSAPSLHRADRSQLALYVNGRWIHDARLNYAISQAYEERLAEGRFPYACLRISLPPDQVDVNVHPTKAEVRFQEPERVFAAVRRAVESALAGAASGAGALASDGLSAGESAGWFPRRAGEAGAAGALTEEWSNPETAADEWPASAPEPPPRTLPPLRVIGQVGAMYIVAEGPAGLYLIDQHAAHHRLLFEQMRGERLNGPLPAHELAETRARQLPEPQATALSERLTALAELGLRAEAFGPAGFALRALPAPFLQPHCEIDALLPALAAALIEIGESDMAESASIEEALLLALSEAAAYREGQLLTQETQQQLTRALERCPSPLVSPRGKPTLIHITREQLAREFRR